jgi:hypothetical protein
LPSHKVILTNKGFKILSTDIVIDLISLGLAITILAIGGTWTMDKFFLVSTSYIFGGLLYFFYRYKFGYIYIISFIYQITLFLLITPIAFLKWPVLLLTFASIVPFFWKKNVFQKLYFPLGLFMGLLASMYALMFQSLQWIKFPVLSFEPFSQYLSEFHVPGSFFLQKDSGEFIFSGEMFSSIELAGLFSLICVGSILLRQFHFLLDLFLLIGMFFVVAYHFRFDFPYFQERILILVSTWYLILMAPGRNFGFSYLFSLISLVFTGMFSYLLSNGEYLIPPIIIVVLFFFMQSILFYLVTRNIVNRIPILKSLIRK